jgi:DNA mismatch endonuclease (patch repair protein)
MAAVKSKGNATTEDAVKRIFSANGITGWRRYLDSIPGKPDFTFRSSRVAIFVDGCFWHGCTKCRRNLTPSTNKTYWRVKIEKNQTRDRLVGVELRRARWRTLRIWEHEIAKTPAKVAERVRKLVNSPARVSRK